MSCIECANCGEPRPHEDALRSACPTCGSSARMHYLSLEGHMPPPKGALIGHKLPSEANPTESIFISDDPWTISGQVSSAGDVTGRVLAAPPTGESRALPVCEILVRRLNEDGANWTSPAPPSGLEQGFDCIARDGTAELKIQHTQADESQDLWSGLRRREPFELSDASISHGLEAIRASIERKRTRASADTVLALDASLTPWLSMERFAADFRRELGSWATQIGFAAIWVVGPTPRSCHRLDC
jgi:hypothetical protein